MPVHCGAEPSDIAGNFGVSGSEDHRLPREVHTTDRMLRCVLRPPIKPQPTHASAQSQRHSQGQCKLNYTKLARPVWPMAENPRL